MAAKKLTKTNVNRHHRRLQLLKAAVEGFMREELREEERREVMGLKSKGLGVIIYDSLFEGGWTEVVEAYGVRPEDVDAKELVANVWSFRRRDGGGGEEEGVGNLLFAGDVVACGGGRVG
ncbi:hypothetical protein QJS10_CPB04g00233 [Acorus calamus]|uniref:Uncharacterized protein n=1 Tax=Acorus calamus TaxID=4465 RepID=A0AAV9F289_ACOCL|nr:hypothetical protein QJS10_CPB04g00233 [Acorus calamus]